MARIESEAFSSSSLQLVLICASDSNLIHGSAFADTKIDSISTEPRNADLCIRQKSRGAERGGGNRAPEVHESEHSPNLNPASLSNRTAGKAPGGNAISLTSAVRSMLCRPPLRRLRNRCCRCTRAVHCSRLSHARDRGLRLPF
jgi:hypothetical protein